MYPDMTGTQGDFLTKSSKSPASIAKSNKQWVGDLHIRCDADQERIILIIRHRSRIRIRRPAPPITK